MAGYPRRAAPACKDAKTRAPVERGKLSEETLQLFLRPAYTNARSAGLRRDRCSGLISNGGREVLVISEPAFSAATPEEEGCWSREALALHRKLFLLFGDER